MMEAFWLAELHSVLSLSLFTVNFSSPDFYIYLTVFSGKLLQTFVKIKVCKTNKDR